MRLSIDSNILIYAYDRTAGRRHSEATRLMARAALGDCIVTLQCLAEFVHVTSRKRKLSLAEAASVVSNLRLTFAVVAASVDALEAAIAATRSHRLSFWDAMLWATVRRAGCELLLTEDMQDGRRLGGVTFVNPFDPRNHALLERALPSI